MYFAADMAALEAEDGDDDDECAWMKLETTSSKVHPPSADTPVKTEREGQGAWVNLDVPIGMPSKVKVTDEL